MEITGKGPEAVGGFNRDYAMMCESLEFPGQNMMSSADTLRFGPQREFINGVTYGSIQAGFICSPDLREKRFFELWQQETMDMVTWEPKYYADYIGGMKIYQLDRANNATYVVELFEVYPKTITAQDIGNATSDAYQTVTLELDFHHWIWADEATDPRRTAVSRSVDNGGSVDEFGGMQQANKNRLAKEKAIAHAVDDFADMPGQEQPTRKGGKWRVPGAAIPPGVTVNRGIISVPAGTKTTASWQKNPNR